MQAKEKHSSKVKGCRDGTLAKYKLAGIDHDTTMMISNDDTLMTIPIPILIPAIPTSSQCNHFNAVQRSLLPDGPLAYT